MTAAVYSSGRVHAPGAAVDARPYDFESPELISGDARARLESAFETFGRQLGLAITAKTRAVVDVATSPFAVQSYAAFAEPDGERVVFVTARLGDTGRAVYRIPVAEARYWAGRMLGAGGVGGGDRPLNAVERALAWSAAEEHLAELRPSTGNLLPEPSVESFGSAPTGVDPDGLAVAVTVGLLRKGERRRIALALPAELVLEAVGAAAGPQDATVVAARLGAHLALAPVEVRLGFDATRVGPSTVLDLAPGDLIPLAHPAARPLVLALDGTEVLRAAVGTSGDRLACVVVDSNGGTA